MVLEYSTSTQTATTTTTLTANTTGKKPSEC